MADIALIGDKDTVMLAKAAGLDVYGVDNPLDAAKTVAKLARSGVKVIFITEPIYAQNTETVAKYKTQPFPAIIPIPDNNGSSGLAMDEIRANVEKAIGMDIL